MKYDYLIVGAGLYGSVFANEAKKKGKKCLVIDKRNQAGGNIYCENIEGINVHKYGAHIFHTNKKEIWNYVNKYCEMIPFINSPLANFKGKLYNLPFNMNTFYQLWQTKTPKEARERINDEISKIKLNGKVTNLEEQALSLVGKDIYEKLIKGYTEKQWGRSAKELPAFIIKRVPLRFTYDNNYFNDTYQGIPKGGYNKLIEELLSGVDLKLNCNYLDNKQELDTMADKVIYTGMIDEFYNYKFGALEYRSLKFEEFIINEEDYQGNAVINFTDKETPYTRIIEHKHFEKSKAECTVISKEYPAKFEKGKEPYYPVNDDRNQEIYNKYFNLAKSQSKYIFGGRLGEYKYYNMDQVIEKAIELYNTL